MTVDRSDLARGCRAALEQVARAEHFSMADWLAVRPDGRTVKAAYAEAARLAHELSVHIGASSASGSAGIPPTPNATGSSRTGGPDARAPRERERRAVLILTRELRECLERVAASVERGDPLPARTEETMVAVQALLSPAR